MIFDAKVIKNIYNPQNHSIKILLLAEIGLNGQQKNHNKVLNFIVSGEFQSSKNHVYRRL